MATYSKVVLSGSTDGKLIKVAATSTPGTLIHTAHATSEDEIWLYAVNSDTTARKLTIEWGGVTSPDDTIEVTIQPEAGLAVVVSGLVLTNSLVVRAFCATANVVMIGGFVNRITP
jgi:hypothetical protein